MVRLIENGSINSVYFNFKHMIIFIDRIILLKILPEINIQFMSIRINAKNLSNRKYNIFEYAFISKYDLEINR